MKAKQHDAIELIGITAAVAALVALWWMNRGSAPAQTVTTSPAVDIPAASYNFATPAASTYTVPQSSGNSSTLQFVPPPGIDFPGLVDALTPNINFGLTNPAIPAPLPVLSTTAPPGSSASNMTAGYPECGCGCGATDTTTYGTPSALAIAVQSQLAAATAAIGG